MIIICRVKHYTTLSSVVNRKPTRPPHQSCFFFLIYQCESRPTTTTRLTCKINHARTVALIRVFRTWYHIVSTLPKEWVGGWVGGWAMMLGIPSFLPSANRTFWTLNQKPRRLWNCIIGLVGGLFVRFRVDCGLRG